jgi:hypothetical protein
MGLTRLVKGRRFFRFPLALTLIGDAIAKDVGISGQLGRSGRPENWENNKHDRQRGIRPPEPCQS